MDPIRNVGFLFKAVSRLWVRHFEQRATQFGMTLTHAKVLVFLSRNEGTTQARLAELSDTDPMTLVRVLDRMEKDGWLERRPDPSDRRAYRLFLKRAADPVLAEINRIGDKARGEALAGLSQDERAHLLTLLERIHANLVELVPNTNSSETARPATSGSSNSTLRSARRAARSADVRRRKATS
jgi:MarR family transcriptional regulator, transcriptional regulator for hemolysin